MLFPFHCPSCQGKLEVDASLSGSQADCPQCGRPVAIPAPRVAAGTTLAGFRLEQRLGKGGMGEVYLAQQLSVERQVAVKVLPPGFAENPDAVKRFLKEGRLAARLDHHNIVTVHEAGEDSGNYYLAMAYIEGESLDQRLKRDKVLPEAEALTIVRAIADALAYAWETHQLLHRDLKPANIMVDHRKRVFLMDLGLAKTFGDESGMTLSGSILGTPQYMSPEQARGLADLGVPTDVYALGATLYHLVTGSPPFTGETTLTVLHKHMFEPLPPPRSRNPTVTDACSHLIEAMMVKEPAARCADWRALIADIDRVLQGKPPAAHRPGAGASVVMPGPSKVAVPAAAAVSKASLARQAQDALARQHQSQTPKPAAAPAAPTTTKRPPWLAIGIAAAVVVVLTLLGGLVLRGRGPAAAAARKGTDAAKGTDRTDASQGTAGAVAPRVAPAPGGPGAPVPGHAAATPAAPPSPSTTPAASAVPTPGQPWTVPDLGLELVWVAPGGFEMGADVARPVHAVRISRGFWMGKYEVTQAEYEAQTGRNPSMFKGARNPVEGVSWDDAVAFCAKLTEQERNAGRLTEGYEYRLPTEAEWEYAARGGANPGGYTYSGSNREDEVAWWKDNSDSTSHPAGEKQPNELGLYDLSGNVWEWCLDWLSEGYYARSPVSDPVSVQAGAYRVRRGGGWDCTAGECGVASRGYNGQPNTCGNGGFRACLGPVVSADTPVAVAPVAAEPPTPAPAPTPGSATTPDPAQARLNALLDQVAADLAAGRPADALRRWQAGCNAPELKPLGEQVTAIGKTVGDATSIPQHVLESFKTEVGKTVEVELAREKITCEVREVTAAGIKVDQAIRQGQGTGTLRRTIALGELSMPERLRRLGTADSPALNLRRGLLALEAGQPGDARRLFAQAGGPLGEALVAQMEAQRAEASEAAATQALSDLLRQISGSPELGKPAKVTASIRKRCGDDPKRAQAARKTFATFEQEWGDSAAGREWIPVVRKALMVPIAGDLALRVPDLGLELVPLAAGEFLMGLSTEGPDLVHKVLISKPLWIGKHEVTQAEFEAIMGWNRSKFRDPRRPVETVSSVEAAEFCRKLTERERAAARVPDGYEFRLPTEAEWEYACRAGTTGDYAGTLDEMGWYDSNSGGETHPVGTKRPNAWGLCDMHGNVFEWCQDAYSETYYARSPAADPVCLKPENDSNRWVTRGGCFVYAAWSARSGQRCDGWGQLAVIECLGFRVVLAPPIVTAAP